MSGAGWALQQAVFAVLAADAALHDLVAGRIFDAVPRQSIFPYVALGEATETAAGTATDAASEHGLAVSVWSRSGGLREVKQIAAAVCVALERNPPAPAGQTLVNFAFVSADYARVSDGETWRATMRFRALTEPQL